MALVITRKAIDLGLPLDPEALVTKSGGQVLGLGKGAVQKILAEHGIARVLASEGGRTSRGSLGNMREYVGFLNRHSIDLDPVEVEAWWIARVRDFFDASPLRMRLDPQRSIRSCIEELLEEARTRQLLQRGGTVVGALLQHLVGAKLSLLHPDLDTGCHGYSVADAPTGRPGDFLVGSTVFHVTTAPSEGLLDKCGDNLSAGLRPLIVTTSRGLPLAQELSEQSGISTRIEILDIVQFLSSNLLERSAFEAGMRRDSLQELIACYNTIIKRCETDPSLHIALD